MSFGVEFEFDDYSANLNKVVWKLDKFFLCDIIILRYIFELYGNNFDDMLLMKL